MRDNGIEPTIIEYLKDVPSVADLKTLSEKMGIGPTDFVRKKEADFKENGLKTLLVDDDALLLAMSKFPKIIERPIVVKEDKAILGRPPENVLTLL